MKLLKLKFGFYAFVKSFRFRRLFQIFYHFFLKITSFAPESCFISVSDKCNFSCVYCSNPMGKSNSKEIHTMSWMKILDKLSKMGVLRVHFTGGEALMRKDIVSLISYAQKKGLFSVLETNGFYLSSFASELKKAGLNFAVVSLDSDNPKKNDVYRKKGAFNNVLKGLSKCREVGIPTVISFCATKENLNQTDLRNLSKIGMEYGVVGMRINPPRISGRLKDKSYFISEEQFRNIPNSYYDGLDNEGVCPAGKKNVFHIDSGGFVTPCPYIKKRYGDFLKKGYPLNMWRGYCGKCKLV